MTNTIMVMFLMQQKYKNNQYDESDDNRNFAAVSRLMPIHDIPSGIFSIGCENNRAIFPFFDITDAEIGLAAVVDKPPFTTLFRSVGGLVNAEVCNGRIGDNLDLQLHWFLRVGFNVNIAVCAEGLFHKAIIARHLAFVNDYILRIYCVQ